LILRKIKIIPRTHVSEKLKTCWEPLEKVRLGGGRREEGEGRWEVGGGGEEGGGREGGWRKEGIGRRVP
jgi:hypothetical protein